jgi:hypothetical protein
MTSITSQYEIHKKNKSNLMICSLRIPNNAWTIFIDNTIEWFALCFVNKECKKYEWKKMLYSEICTFYLMR